MSFPECINDITVVKVGTKTLVEELPNGTERLNEQVFRGIGGQILDLHWSGAHPIIVTSGFIASGMQLSGTTTRPDKEKEMPKLQALSSIGALPVLQAWQESVRPAHIGTVLLTKQQMPELGKPSEERNEALGTLHHLLLEGYIPVVNENDVIAHDEILHGDNDTLAAIIAARMASQSSFFRDVKLILLSNVDGVIGANNRLIKKIPRVAKFAHLAGPSDYKNGIGGMVTKFEAAIIAKKHGVPMWIANGRTEDAIRLAMDGKIGTFFPV